MGSGDGLPFQHWAEKTMVGRRLVVECATGSKSMRFVGQESTCFNVDIYQLAAIYVYAFGWLKPEQYR